jgi:lipopolysaccharide transport system permease protein
LTWATRKIWNGDEDLPTDYRRSSTIAVSHQWKNGWQYAHPLYFARQFVAYREIIWQFTRRQVQERYRSSYLGILWTLITPLLSLLIYTFVFSVIFKSRWTNVGSGGVTDAALIIFSGIVVFNVFADCVTHAPTLVIRNPNYVKKVVFPLEILPVSALGAALINSSFGLVIVLAGLLMSSGSLHWTLIYLPLVYLPLAAFTLGLSWLLASLGVFIRDIGNFIGTAVQLLFFLTPIVYPLSAVPQSLQIVLRLNPLTAIVEDFRRVALWGMAPDWPWLGEALLLACLVMFGGYMWFMRSKQAFADVL